jgi:nicotinate-nucleotide pyrophosphorylase (carboxylating)
MSVNGYPFFKRRFGPVTDESKTMKLDSETRQDVLKLVRLALSEDLGDSQFADGRDCTTAALVPPNQLGTANLVSRDTGVMAGIEVAKMLLQELPCQVELTAAIQDGDPIRPQQTIGHLTGPAAEILRLERILLNFLGRLSGISSLTRQYVDLVCGTHAKIYDTRKTTPGWRRLEKYAVACGGGANHRMGLYDAIMIKDNHLAFFRSQMKSSSDTISQAVVAARNWINLNRDQLPQGINTILQLEVDTIDQFQFALQTDCDIVLLDNMTIDQLRQAVMLRNQHRPQMQLEASGGVNLQTVSEIAKTGVERISVGALTHSAVNFDIGLDWN